MPGRRLDIDLVREVHTTRKEGPAYRRRVSVLRAIELRDLADVDEVGIAVALGNGEEERMGEDLTWAELLGSRASARRGCREEELYVESHSRPPRPPLDHDAESPREPSEKDWRKADDVVVVAGNLLDKKHPAPLDGVRPGLVERLARRYIVRDLGIRQFRDRDHARDQVELRSTG
jgi:hypothetical protein